MVITQTELPGIERIAQGKVRDVYSIGDKILGDPLLIVATDRISAFDCILPQGIPDKGRVLTQMSLFWFDFLGVPNHLITANVDEYPAPLHAYRDQLEGRSMLVKRCKMEPIVNVSRERLRCGAPAGKTTNEPVRSAAIPLPAEPARMRCPCPSRSIHHGDESRNGP